MDQSLSRHSGLDKNACPDCKMCQGCSETRCRACRGHGKLSLKGRLSIKDQIALFNRLNPALSTPESQLCACPSCDGK